MKLFKSAKSMLEEVARMRTVEKYRRLDRARVGEFFNGAPPLTDAEAEELGFTINTNHLFGYTELAESKNQTYGLYTKPTALFDVNLHCAPAGKAIEWGQKAKMHASRVLKKIGAFDSQYEGAAGDAVLHGEAVFFFPNRTFPMPRQAPLSRMLVPDSASTNKDELTHFCIDDVPMFPKDLSVQWKKGLKGWNTTALSRLLKHVYRDCSNDSEITADNAEEAEYRRQENSAGGEEKSRSVKVCFFYRQRPDKFGCPYDLTVLYDPSRVGITNATTVDDSCILYSDEDRYANASELIHPLFMDCILGGESKWHRVLGFGHLNYQLNHTIELMICRLQQGGIESSMNLWQASNSASREAMQEILLHHNAIVPEGMSLVQNRTFEPNFNGLLSMIQFFRQQGGRNISGTTPNQGDQNDVLEVQAIAEQQRAGTMTNSRFSKLYRHHDFMWEEVFARLSNCYIDEREPGYSVVMDFQNAMEREGIPMHYLQRENVHIEATRLVGDGIRSKEVAIAQFLTSNRSSYAPEVQPRITRLCTALALDNYALAEQLTPIQEEPDSPQMLRADSENAVMLTQRTPQKPKPDDIDELHIAQHFPALEVLLQDALEYQKGAFTPKDAKSFQAIGAHIYMHIQRIEGKGDQAGQNENRDKARGLKEQLNEYAALGQKCLNQMEQMQEGKGEDMDPIEMQKLQLAVESLKLQREKLQFTQQKFDRTQSHREASDAFAQNMNLGKEYREDLRQRQEARLKDVETALKVAQAGSDNDKSDE